MPFPGVKSAPKLKSAKLPRVFGPSGIKDPILAETDRLNSGVGRMLSKPRSKTSLPKVAY